MSKVCFFDTLRQQTIRGRGGIGIRASLRCLFPQGIGGSSPLVRTIYISATYVARKNLAERDEKGAPNGSTPAPVGASPLVRTNTTNYRQCRSFCLMRKIKKGSARCLSTLIGPLRVLRGRVALIVSTDTILSARKPIVWFPIEGSQPRRIEVRALVAQRSGGQHALRAGVGIGSHEGLDLRHTSASRTIRIASFGSG